MKSITIICCLLLFSLELYAQKDFNLYQPEVDAALQINEGVARANREGKHVFVEVGGNWCKWCRIFHNWSEENKTIDSLLRTDFVVIHVNYSKENKNPEAMKRLDYPQRFGFPVFVILDGSGNRLHTQNTAYLEENEGYSEKKVVDFLKSWNTKAVNAATYQ